jgi:hypothetical protein
MMLDHHSQTDDLLFHSPMQPSAMQAIVIEPERTCASVEQVCRPVPGVPFGPHRTAPARAA